MLEVLRKKSSHLWWTSTDSVEYQVRRCSERRGLGREVPVRASMLTVGCWGRRLRWLGLRWPPDRIRRPPEPWRQLQPTLQRRSDVPVSSLPWLRPFRPWKRRQLLRIGIACPNRQHWPMRYRNRQLRRIRQPPDGRPSRRMDTSARVEMNSSRPLVRLQPGIWSAYCQEISNSSFVLLPDIVLKRNEPKIQQPIREFFVFFLRRWSTWERETERERERERLGFLR